MFVKLQPYHQVSLRGVSYNKLNHRFFRHFHIIKRIGAVGYKLYLLATTQLLPIFHVSCLKACQGNHFGTSTPLPPLIDISGVQVRAITRQSQLVLQLLVQWEHLSEAEATWEDLTLLSSLYPSLNLEGKVHLDEGGNVMINGLDSITHEESNR